MGTGIPYTYRTAALALAVIVLLLAPLPMVPLFDKDEGAFAEATREMVVSGNYLMTYLNGEPRYDKPLLTNWLQAASVHLFGLNEFAVRLPSALAALAWLVLVYRFTATRFDRTTAFFVAWMLLTALQITIMAKAAIADALLNLCVTACMIALWRYYADRDPRALYLAFTAAALGVLTKGPIAVLIPFGTALTFAFFQKDWAWWRQGLGNWRAWGIFLGIALPWPMLAYLDQGNALIYAWFVEQTLKRAAGPLEGHGGGMLYYIPIVVAGLLPFTPLLIVVLRRFRHEWQTPLHRYLLLWFLVVFVLFSLMGTKLPHYIVYGYPPLLMLMAARRNDIRRGYAIGLWPLLLVILLLILPLLAPVIGPRLDDAFARDVVADAAVDFRWWYFAGLGAAALALMAATLGRWHVERRLLVAGAALAMAVNYVIMPAAARVLQAPVQEVAALAAEQDLDVVLYKFKMPSFLFYRGALAEERLPRDGEIVLAKSEDFADLEEKGLITGKDVIYYRNGIVMARVRSLLK
ncbi:MAG: glycosyltransferase family 39 protein [Candidatus Hydrogenedentes bacterium]|nr:glycosyltransferase family 39 protein [Candidatus Hydrogenedentota bacterium]